tara:strand:- start:7866 stop:8084 length:219 start_codon:yes stop_codon:yes gene_type:complete
MTDYETVADIDKDQDFILVNSDREVESIREYLKDKTEYLTYFVKEKNGEYVEVYGITQMIPYLRLPVYKLEL